MGRHYSIQVLEARFAQKDGLLGTQHVGGCYNARPSAESPAMLPDLQMNDVLRLRKPHPCGNTDWVVVRLGADIGLKCLGCGRRILLPRREVSRRMKSYVNKAGANG
jgi:hypothetical protein